jgi:predicted DNA-binding protein with PD1-like motif
MARRLEAGFAQKLLTRRANGGHLPEAGVWPTLEALLVESPAYLRRETAEETGLALIRL